MRILIVEDELGLALTLRQTLAGEGHEVLMAFDGEEGLRLARSAHPDVLLLDGQLPRRSGLEVARALKADPATRGLSILLMTGRAELLEQAVAEGLVEAALGKPFTLETLLEAVTSCRGAGRRPPEDPDGDRADCRR